MHCNKQASVDKNAIIQQKQNSQVVTLRYSAFVRKKVA